MFLKDKFGVIFWSLKITDHAQILETFWCFRQILGKQKEILEKGLQIFGNFLENFQKTGYRKILFIFYKFLENLHFWQMLKKF